TTGLFSRSDRSNWEKTQYHLTHQLQITYFCVIGHNLSRKYYNMTDTIFVTIISRYSFNCNFYHYTDVS
ncbi:MAG TPA: hypothetical protein VF248_02795, partial [Nitrososphaeraceae archaeon]